MYKEILLAVDLNDIESQRTAIETAIDVTRAFGGRLHVQTVQAFRHLRRHLLCHLQSPSSWRLELPHPSDGKLSRVVDGCRLGDRLTGHQDDSSRKRSERAKT